MERRDGADEIAAIAAAIERFEGDIAAGGDGKRGMPGAWRRAALVEGVGAKASIHDSEGGRRWLS